MSVYLDDILICTKGEGKEHIEAVQQVLEHFWKYSLYAKLKKCRFYQEKMRFLGYIVFYQGIRIEEE